MSSLMIAARIFDPSGRAVPEPVLGALLFGTVFGVLGHMVGMLQCGLDTDCQRRHVRFWAAGGAFLGWVGTYFR